MLTETVSLLSSEAELECYEQGLYRAFVQRSSNTLVGAHYQRLPNERLRSRIPYEDQRIFAVQRGTHICCAVALHERTDGPLQIHQLGLEVPEPVRALGFRELLNLYAEPAPPPESIGLIWQLHRAVARYLRVREIEKVIATCGDRLLPFYRGFGLRSIQSTRDPNIEGVYHLLSN